LALIGVVDGPDDQLLEEVSDVVLESDGGALFVLDGMARRVSRFALDGTPQGSWGRGGAGPNELIDPVALLSLASDTLVVLNRSSASIQFVVWADDGGREVHRVQLPLRPEDGCTLDGKLFVLGLYDRHIVHVLSRDGSVVRSLAASAVDWDATDRATLVDLALRAEAAAGSLFCAEEAGLVIHMPRQLGWVRMYLPTGELFRQLSVAGFAGPRRTESRGGVRYDIDPDVGHANALTSVAIFDGSRLGIRMEFRFPRTSDVDRSPETVVFDLASGEEVDRWKTSQLLVAQNVSNAITLQVAPFPLLVVWRTR
jgi:hypothetical protein